MSKVCIHKLAATYQRIFPGMFEESKRVDMMIPKRQDREGNLYWPCFHCKEPLRDKEGFYITDEDEIEGFERYLKYEETYSEADTMSAERLVDARAAADKFYHDAKTKIAEAARALNEMDDEELRDLMFHFHDTDVRNIVSDIGDDFRELTKNIEFLFNKHYYYENPELFADVKDIKGRLMAGYGYGYWPGYWPTISLYYHGQDLRKTIQDRLSAILKEAWDHYGRVKQVISIASQLIGTQKHLIQRHVMNHPVCDSCFKKVGAECYVAECNFTSSDVDDDFVEVEFSIWDEDTYQWYNEDKLLCEEHGFKCAACGKSYVSNPYESFGEHMEGHGKHEAFGDSYCGECYYERFRECDACNEVNYTEDLFWDEKTDSELCANCVGGGQGRERGVEETLTRKEVSEAKAFALDPFDVGDIGFYPIDQKAIDVQILPALRKASNKRFKSAEQFKAWITKRIQSKDAKAAVLSEMFGYGIGVGFSDDVFWQEHQDRFIQQLISSFTKQSHDAMLMKENYPGLKGFKPLAVDVKIERTPGHAGHSFVIYPKKKLLEYADMVMPGAKEAYNDKLARRGHHGGALAYARFTRSNNRIVVDNLQTDLDSQAFKHELRGGKPSKPLQWWLTAIKKFWVPYMLNLLRQYGQKTDQKVYLTSFPMQKRKWRTIPERNKDIYERVPDMMGLPQKRVEVKPEDLARDKYKMRRIAELVDAFYKMAQGRKLNLKRLASKMFQVDKLLTPESANWNHNLASAFRIMGKVAGRPDRVERVLENFHPEDWLQRGTEPLKEIKSKDPVIAKEIKDVLYYFVVDPESAHAELNTKPVEQPCAHCGTETHRDAYVRYSEGESGDTISPLCLGCAMKHDHKFLSTAEFLARWNPKEYTCENCGFTGTPSEVGSPARPTAGSPPTCIMCDNVLSS